VISPLLHILPATQTVWKISTKKAGSNNNIKKHHIPLISASLPCHQPPQALQGHIIKNREIAVGDLGFYLQADGMATFYYAILTWPKTPAPKKS